MDEIETLFGTPVEEMNPDQLLSYFELSKNSVLGIRLPAGGAKASGIFKSFQQRYGQLDAGRIVKFAVYNKNCSFAGQILTASSFAIGNQWITDGLSTEMQLFFKKQERDAKLEERETELRKGFATIDDLRPK